MRIEDIDPPREQKGASAAILKSLESHGLHWDGEVRYQSQRNHAYNSALSWLEKEELIYPCNCTRKRLHPLNGHYDGHCRLHPPTPNQAAALRLKVGNVPPPYAHISSDIIFEDQFKGIIKEALKQSSGDFIIHRKDGLFAYQLAVVVDDIDQGITHIVRGDDLLDTTAKQIYLFRLLGQTPPKYGHIPVIKDHHGNKLSKQNHAPALKNQQAVLNLIKACTELNIPLVNKNAGDYATSDEVIAAAMTSLSGPS